MQAAEIRRSENRPTNDLAAYDLYLRSLGLTFAWERNSVIRAIDLLEQAIQRDPRYGPALALEAMCYQNLHINGWSKDPEADRRLSIDLARRAIWVASDDPIVLSTAAHALGYFEENINPAMMGDQKWGELLQQHHLIVRRELARFRGREVNNV